MRRLINVDGHLFEEGGDRHRVNNEPVILGDTGAAKLYASMHGFDLIDHTQYTMEREEARNRFVGPPKQIVFDTEEVVVKWPMPSNGLLRRGISPTHVMWECFAPGFPAWVGETRVAVWHEW